MYCMFDIVTIVSCFNIFIYIQDIYMQQQWDYVYVIQFVLQNIIKNIWPNKNHIYAVMCIH